MEDKILTPQNDNLIEKEFDEDEMGELEDEI